MSAIYRKMVRLVLLLVVMGLFTGCAQQGSQEASTNLAPQADLGATIGSLAQVIGTAEVAVEGYGLVGGLSGTGSAECPPRIRAYLKKYIATQVPDSTVDIDKLIDSDSTAVVWIEAFVPSDTIQRYRFDVKVVSLSGTQTTSLEDGWLYTAELWPRGAIGISGRPLGAAEGPVFIDTLGLSEPDKRQGYIIGGGKAATDYKVAVLINKPDYRMAAIVRNKLNERFGFSIANAVSSSQIDLNVPESYKRQELKFVEIVRATYLEESPELTKNRIKTYITRLATTEDKHESEIALEAIGRESIAKLSVLLNSSDQRVRLSAARCMLNLGSERGVPALKKIVMDANSPYRLEALESLSGSPNRADAVEVATALLREKSITMVMAAYEQLRKLNDPAVVQEVVARSFFIDKVPQMPQKAIFVARSGKPRIVLFGAPIYCRNGFSMQSNDGNIMIDHQSGQEYVSVARKHPTRSAIVGPIMTTLDLSDIIKTLCGEPAKVEQGRRNGLGVSYDDMVAMVKQMCDKDIITAEFWAGPLPEIAQAVKK